LVRLTVSWFVARNGRDDGTPISGRSVRRANFTPGILSICPSTPRQHRLLDTQELLHRNMPR
jgi:hypothetical protein